jgi:hypothetical protein
MTQCECTEAGFCKRHNVAKCAHFVSLCQKYDEYFEAWEDARGPGQLQDPALKTVREKRQAARKQKRLDRYHELWDELHGYAIATFHAWSASAASAWYRDHWLKKVPSSGCKACRSHWLDITTEHPPVFGNPAEFFEWTVARHNDVNSSLGRPPFPLVAAWARYLAIDVVDLRVLRIPGEELRIHPSCVNSGCRS